jgi:hypothetical protein
MADWQKKGMKGNVDDGPGSKGNKSADGGSGAGRAHGPDVTAHSGGSAAFSSGKKTSADATEQTHNVAYAEGGDTKMFGEQEAGSRTSADKSKSTGKPDSSGPGEKFASGGKGKMFGFTGALPATAGISAARAS